MRVLVTGGSGFLGSHIAEELVRRGYAVVSLDREDPPTDAYRTIRGDVRSLEDTKLAMAGCNAVYHCAAIADLNQARAEPRLSTDVNVMGTLTLLEAAATLGVKRFVQASSVYVYSHSGSIYRTTKRAAEGLVRDYAEMCGLESTILRFGSLYGPRADPNNSIFRLVHQAIHEGRIEFWGDGSEVREYAHISDAAGLAVDALAPQYVGQVLHIAGRERISTRELIDMINEMMGGDLEVVMRNDPFEGRYRSTPYSFEAISGRRLTGETYVDLGLGILQALREVDEERMS